MLFAAHVATLNQPDEKGVPQRVHLEGLVRRGVASEAVMQELEGPPFPDALDYLWTRFQRLHAMRPEAAHGLGALTPPVILAADTLFQWNLEPHEVEAIADLDVVTRHPETMKERD